MAESVGIVGAGLVGTLIALGLAHKGYKVTLFDYRPDSRTLANKANLRSINLAVSARGIEALKYVDLEMARSALTGIIPMYGRMIHDLQGNQESQIYGLFGESINSIDRAKLNELLYDEIDKFNKNNDNKINVEFHHKVKNVSLKSTPTVVCSTDEEDDLKFEFDFIIGADGAFSQVRSSLQRYIRMDYSQEYIDMCYLELYIPAGPNNTFSIDPNHLHIWPRKDFMLIALANQDGSFTSTWFGPWKLTESLNSPTIITEFFNKNFPDAVELIGIDKVVECFMTYPKGSLMQVNCNQYHYQDKCVIIGDAAHSMVPFYGQGMNCGFEDVRILLQLLDKHKGDRSATFEAYTETRHDDLKAILKLALDNYKEMSSKVISWKYLFRKKLDGILGKALPQYWVPLYTMVSFRADINYADCIKNEKRQKKILSGVEFSLITAGAIGLGAFLSRRLK